MTTRSSSSTTAAATTPPRCWTSWHACTRRTCGSSIMRRTAATAARCVPALPPPTKEWLFYTDGDAQYDPHELTLLVPAMTDGVDMVNGYKIERNDPLHRIIIGRFYQMGVKAAFGLQPARRGLRLPADAPFASSTRCAWKPTRA